MDPFVTSHISHDALLRDIKTLDERDRKTTAVLLSRVAEVEERRLFLREGFPSMHAYCIQGLHWCEGTASRRIYAARAARALPILFDAIADGRLHLTGVLMLAKYLTTGNVAELIAAATHRSKAEIQQLIAERFPQPDLPEFLQNLAPPPPLGRSEGQHSPENAAPRAPRVTPLAPQRFGLQVTLDQETHDLLRRAQALMSHQVRAGEILPVLNGALRCFVAQLEKQKYAATSCPRPSKPGSTSRHIPADVKRVVRERDGDQCAFVSDGGQRCSSRTRLEFDHIEPVSRGGAATVENLRLVCRAHNQYAAERAFGAEFMEQKRWESRYRPAP